MRATATAAPRLPPSASWMAAISAARGSPDQARKARAPSPAPGADLAPAAVLDQVGAELVDHEGELALLVGVEAHRAGGGQDLAARLSHLARLGDRERQRGARDDHFHLVMQTRVPWPGVDVMSNSFERRRAPPRPSPRPEPVVKPSRRACGTSGMPGPLSAKVSRSPRRSPSCRVSSRATPPPPWAGALPASPLAAVTSLV